MTTPSLGLTAETTLIALAPAYSEDDGTCKHKGNMQAARQMLET
jgi:hypothetical protein